MSNSKMFTSRATVAFALLAACTLMVPGLASAQQIPGVTRASMEAAFTFMSSNSLGAISIDADYDGDGQPTLVEMGCFGELSEAMTLDPAIVAAFNANLATHNANAPGLNAEGYQFSMTYLATIIGDGQGGSTDAVVATINGFSDVFGPAANLADLSSYDISAQAITKSAVYVCLGIVNQTVGIVGPDSLLLGAASGVTYTAATVDPTDPMFSETHTFSSSDTGILTIDPDGTNAIGVSVGTANIEALGGTSAVIGTKAVTVRFAEWHEICDLDDAFNGIGNAVGVALGCAVTGTPNYFAEDFDIDNDGVRDSWQLQLAAFSLCQAESGLTVQAGGPDPAGVYASYESNIAIIDQYFVDMNSMLDWAIGDGGVEIDISGGGGIDYTTTGAGETLALSASSTDSLDITFAWTSGNLTQATVDAVTGLVTIAATATPGGTTVITATGVNSGNIDTQTVTMFDLATENRVAVSGASDACDGAADQQLTATTTGADAGEMYTWMSSDTMVATVDAAGLVTHVDVGTATVTATGADSSAAGTADIEVFGCTGPCDQAKSAKATTTLGNGQIKRGADIVATYFGGANAEANVLGIDVAPAGGLNATIGGMASLAGVNTGLRDIAEGFLAFSGAEEWIAAYAGTGFVAEGTVVAILDGTATVGPGVIDFLVNGPQVFAGTVADWQFVLTNTKLLLDGTEGAVGGDFTLAGFPGLDGLQVLVDAALTDQATYPAPTYTVPNFDIFVTGVSKIAGALFEGDEVYAPGTNPSDNTNAEYHALVTAGGGDSGDYIDLVAGMNLLAAGSPFLPAAGALAIGLLIGGTLISGGLRLRRKS